MGFISIELLRIYIDQRGSRNGGDSGLTLSDLNFYQVNLCSKSNLKEKALILLEWKKGSYM